MGLKISKCDVRHIILFYIEFSIHNAWLVLNNNNLRNILLTIMVNIIKLGRLLWISYLKIPLSKKYWNLKKESKKNMIRLSVLKAAGSLADVPREPPDRCHELKGNRKGQFAVDLKHPFRLVFEPYPENMKSRPIDLKQVKAIMIISVEDYH